MAADASAAPALEVVVVEWERADGSVVLLLTPSLMGDVGESKSLDSLVRFFFKKPSDGMNQAPLSMDRLALEDHRSVRGVDCGGRLTPARCLSSWPAFFRP